MACNCATEEYINKLYKEFGEKKPSLKNFTVEEKIVFYIGKFINMAIMSVTMPMLFIYIQYKTAFGDGKISMKDFFGLKPISIEDYVREQQELQNTNQSW